MWYQKTLTLSAKSRGFHLVTDEILNQLADMPRVNIGLLHLLLQHTSAPLHPVCRGAFLYGKSFDFTCILPEIVL